MRWKKWLRRLRCPVAVLLAAVMLTCNGPLLRPDTVLAVEEPGFSDAVSEENEAGTDDAEIPEEEPAPEEDSSDVPSVSSPEIPEEELLPDEPADEDSAAETPEDSLPEEPSVPQPVLPGGVQDRMDVTDEGIREDPLPQVSVPGVPGDAMGVDGSGQREDVPPLETVPEPQPPAVIPDPDSDRMDVVDEGIREDGPSGDHEQPSVYVSELRGDVTVTVEGASGLPDGASLSVSRLQEGSDAWLRAVRAAVAGAALPEGTGMLFVPYDVHFTADGEEIEPGGPVQVSMAFASDPFRRMSVMSDLQCGGPSERGAVHVLDDGTVEVIPAEWDGSRVLTFETASFSVMGPMAVDETGSQSSGNLGEFLDELKITDAEGHVLSEDELQEAGDYEVYMHFKDSIEKFFRPATREEMIEAGIPAEDIPDGEWMYLELGDDFNAADLQDDGNVKVVGNGRYLLVKYQRPGGFPMDEVGINVKGHLETAGEDGKFHIAVGSEEGNYTPPASTEPYIHKESLEYDPVTHQITYEVTITNPTDTPMTGFRFDDRFSVETGGSAQPKLVPGSVTVGGEPFSGPFDPDGMDGSFRFDYILDEPLQSGGRVTVRYQLDVTELFNQLNETSSEFVVENTADVTAKGDERWTEKSDTAEHEVDLGYLKKNGRHYVPEKDDSGAAKPWWGVEHESMIEWIVEAYDPYQTLDDLKLYEFLPEPFHYGDIVGVYFENGLEGEDHQNTYIFSSAEQWQNKSPSGQGGPGWTALTEFMTDAKDQEGDTGDRVLFDFSKMPEALKDWLKNHDREHGLFGQDGHYLKMHILTKYEPEGYHVCDNAVEAKLPSETVPREAHRTEIIGTQKGVELHKEGALASDGRKIHYSILADVAPGVGEQSGYMGAGGIGAGLVDEMYVKDSDPSSDDGKTVMGYLDIHLALENVSVKIQKQKEDGSFDDMQTALEQVNDAAEKSDANTPYSAADHVFEIFSVTQYSADTESELKETNPVETGQDGSCWQLAFVINPRLEVSERSDVGPDMKRVRGTWPSDANENQCRVLIEYDINPEKAYFIDNTNPRQATKAPFSGCDTLQRYWKGKEDIVVMNSALFGVQNDWMSAYAEVNLTTPLRKEAELTVDLANDQKYVEYTLTFQNGRENNGAIPDGAQGLYIKDTFDEKMQYMDGTLSAEVFSPDGVSLGTYEYKGSSPVPEGQNVLYFKFSDFVKDGQTLQELFNQGHGHWDFRFTYRLEAGPNMTFESAYVSIDNTAEVGFSYQGKDQVAGTDSAEVDHFPTGALTKQAALVNGRVEFYVDVNAAGAELAPKKDDGTPGGKLTVTDSASGITGLEMDWDSLKVEKESGDGSWVLMEKDTGYDSQSDAVPAEGKYGLVQGTESGKFSIVIPDETHVRIFYAYKTTDEWQLGPQPDVTIANSVTIEGTELTDGSNSRFTSGEVNASALSSGAGFDLHKLDRANRRGIEHVSFLLYSLNTGDDPIPEEVTALAEKIEKETVEYAAADGSRTTLYPVALFVTDAEGNVRVEWEHLRPDGLYALVEAEAPEGFVILDKPIFFRIDSRSVTLMDPVPAGVSVDGLSMTVLNDFEAVLPEAGGAGISMVPAAAAVCGVFLALLPGKRKRRRKHS